MWILVVTKADLLERSDGAYSQLKELGCRVRSLLVGGPIDAPELLADPPAAMLVEIVDSVDEAIQTLAELRRLAPLKEVAALIATPIGSLARLDGRDGFDDVVLIPYVPTELYVRIRRAEWRRGEFVGQEIIKIGPLCIDLAAHDVTLDGRRVDMTRQEFALLRFLCQNRGRVFSRDELLSRVWGASHYGSSRTVDMHMRRLRTKICHPALPLETVRGVGYILRAA